MKTTRHSRRRLGGGKTVPSDPASTPNPPPRQRRQRAFTLIEIILALALVGMMAAVLVGGSARMLSDKPETADDVFWKSVAAARKRALLAGRDVRLGYVDDRENGKRFTIGEGADLKAFPVTAAPPDLAVNFMSAQKVVGSVVILAGQVVETQSLPYVTFYGDGTCTAFRIQIRAGVDAHVLSIDPWTCAQVLVPTDSFPR
ncbi:MAG TPA: type II secretion system protein [Opitutaceae bacterium]|nr:type II secretion system protein [Opitutaceae bacterium]